MRKVVPIIAEGIAICVISILFWQMIVMRNNLREKIGMMNMMISRYEAKAQFLEDYLPMVSAYTGSDITAKRILAAVYENSRQYDLAPELLLSVIQVESEFNPRAYSRAGAIGLMQIMPVTGIYVGRTLGLRIDNEQDLYDIEKNIQIGAVFIKECIERMGEQRGLGYYYAGRHTQHYPIYTRKIAAAKELWLAAVADPNYSMQ
ncbi:transglycosylase SLT domain-containing protein [candidate division WOR-3 bacterium]|nr:transglycosylase SLT domain-containing protein [candidate division WOR-3 bacterium]